MRNVSITELTTKRKEAVTERISRYWSDGITAKEVVEKIKINPKHVATPVKDIDLKLSVRSVAAFMGNLNKKYVD